MIGFQQYRPMSNKQKSNNPRESRYFTWRKNKSIGVWGLESWKLSNTLFVTEGIFDAARLTAYGYSAIATLSNDVDASLARWLWTTRKIRPVIAICDNDSAGRKLARISTTHHTVKNYKDLGESSSDYVKNILREYGNAD